MGETFDIFAETDDLLEVLVLSVREDGVVDYYSIDGRVVVGGDEGFLGVVFGDFEKGVLETTVLGENGGKVACQSVVL